MNILRIFFFFNLVFVCYSEESSEELDPKSSEIDLPHVHPYGRPVNVLKFDQNGGFIINNITLDEMFLHPDVKDRKIVAVSIIGAFRKGKSFLMDYALRYMYGHYKSVAFPHNPLNNTANWMGEPDEPLIGFSWRGGTLRDTTGVILWSDIFLHETKDKKKLAIILMDTQGLFDSKTSPTDNSRIFALGTLASSIQIFNLNDVIQENQLEYLQLATEFSQFALKKNKEGKKRAKNFKPFQNLIFLMRDWQNKQEFEYGEIGGGSYLATILLARDDQHESLRNVRNFIKNSFEKLSCFLMPHPGTMVTTDPDYEGQRSGLAEEFEEQLERFLELILKPEKLVAKKILNNEISSAEYVEYLKAYFIAFESNDIPKIETLHSITIRKQFDILINEALAEFKSDLIVPSLNSSTYMEELTENGNNSMKVALQTFKRKKKLGSAEDDLNYTNELKNLLEMHLMEWKIIHTKTYDDFKRIEAQKQKELEDIENLAKEQLEQQQRQSKIELERMKVLNEEKDFQMNQTLAALRAESEQELSGLKAKYEADRIKTEQENEKIFNELKKQNEEMRLKVIETQQRLEEEMIKMKREMNAKQVEMDKLIYDKRDALLDELKIQAQNKRLELEQRFKIEELKLKAEEEQRVFDRRMKIEERRIREEAELQRKEEFEKMLQQMKADQQRMQQTILASIRSG